MSDTTMGTPPQPEDTAAGGNQTACPLGPCRFLGFYSDRAHHGEQPHRDNYCHVSELPFAVPLEFQATTCLGGRWPECAAYRRAVEREADAGRQRPHLVLEPKKLAILAAVVIALVLAAFLATRPGGGDSGLSAMNGPAGLADATPHSLPTGQSVAATPTPLATLASTATSAAPKTPAMAAMGALTATVAATAPATAVADTVTPAETDVAATEPAAVTPETATAAATDTVAAPTTPTATPAPTATETSTAVPLSVAAPVLASPEDGRDFGSGDEIVLHWEPGSALPDGAYYVVTVAYSHLGATWYDEVPWTTDTNWTLSEHRYLMELADNGVMTWSVQVMLKTGEDADGNPVGTALSPASEQWQLTWRAPSGKKPTAPPPPA